MRASEVPVHNSRSHVCGCTFVQHQCLLQFAETPDETMFQNTRISSSVPPYNPFSIIPRLTTVLAVLLAAMRPLLRALKILCSLALPTNLKETPCATGCVTIPYNIVPQLPRPLSCRPQKRVGKAIESVEKQPEGRAGEAGWRRSGGGGG